MAYKDPEVAKKKDKERREKKHAEKYGEGAGPQNGKHGNQAKGSKNGRWNNGRMISSHGYVLVRVGSKHPLCVGNQYAYEHHLVWVSANGPLPDGYVIHHKNDDKRDNRIQNLECITAGEHQKHHADNTRDRDKFGRFA